MTKAAYRKIALLIGLIMCHLADGRVVSPSFYSEGYSPSPVKKFEIKKNENANLRSDRQGRLSEVEFSTYSLKEPNGAGTYAFGYDNVVDPSGNEHFRYEEKLQNGTVIGEYGYTDYKNERIVRVSYIADIRGYRANTRVLPLDVEFINN